MKQTLISFSFLLLILPHTTMSLTHLAPAKAPSADLAAKTPALAPTKPTVQPPTKAIAPAHAPSEVPLVQAPSAEPLVQAPQRKIKPEPTDVAKILDKASTFSVFIRILKSTQVIEQIENQLNTSNSLTIFAPTNDAFSALKPGTLNSLSTEQKVQLVQYHILPSFVSISNFQTLSNPVRTQASNTNEYPLNITTQGNWVNMSTGLVNTTISGTVYADNQLAIYKVDKVLLPLAIFSPTKHKAPAPAAPAPLAKSTKGLAGSDSSSDSSSTSTLDSPVAAVHASNAFRPARNAMAAIGVVLGATLLL
ncbi:fasciclin-like arabinogalactan protein 12 [Humulus lupulus]|uniref:fasciclin-like arabinogalactan protein 12 n=1 Tax=Humulus lupulus TaxID=3486 RepID=UPI002B40295B|nr:fasciclin-like arabinogalactan protein 12 [Humulus lupulus]